MAVDAFQQVLDSPPGEPTIERRAWHRASGHARAAWWGSARPGRDESESAADCMCVAHPGYAREPPGGPPVARGTSAPHVRLQPRAVLEIEDQRMPPPRKRERATSAMGHPLTS